MPPQQLDNLVRIGKLKTEPAAQAELDGLLRSVAARIKDAENEQLSIESRFDLAYNAAHAFSLAALRFISGGQVSAAAACFALGYSHIRLGEPLQVHHFTDCTRRVMD
jgi:hypothetical protein